MSGRNPPYARLVSTTRSLAVAGQLGRQFLDLRRELGHLVLARQVQPRDGFLHGGVDPALKILAGRLRLLEQVIDKFLAFKLGKLGLRGEFLTQLLDLILGHDGQTDAGEQGFLDEIEHGSLLKSSRLLLKMYYSRAHRIHSTDQAQRSKGRIRLMDFSPPRSDQRSMKKPSVALLPFARPKVTHSK